MDDTLEAEPVRARSLGGLKARRLPRGPLGRICVVDECSTLLAPYNLGETCWRHVPVTYPRFNRRRR